MKTICFFNTAKAWGGGEKWHFETALYLKQKGVEVIFITNPDSELQTKVSQTSIPLIPFSVTNLSFINPFKVRKLKNILIENRVDTIVINLSEDLKIAGLASKKAKVRKIIYRRGSAIPIKNNLLNRYYFANVLTDVLTNSEATKRSILKDNERIFPSHKIKVIYNPVDIEPFLKKTYQKVYQKQNPNEIVIANLGRLVEQKNQKFLIDVASALKSRNIEFKILIGGIGKLRRDLTGYAKKRDVVEEVTFLGFVDNVKDLLMSCDVFALSSLWEGFGYVLAEASLCRKPIIALKVSSNPELIVDGKTGFLTAVNDVTGFCDKISYFYHHREETAVFGNNGFDFIRNNFDGKTIREKIKDYLVGDDPP